MIKHFKLTDGTMGPTESGDGCVHVYIGPDAQERDSLRADFGIDEHTLASALDPDEVSRIELNPDQTLLIWKQPTSYMGGDSFLFDVMSIGLVLFKDRLGIIVSTDIQLPTAGTRQTPALRAPQDVLLVLLFNTIHHYLGHLKGIKMIARDLQRKINTSMENQHLIQMFNLSESLVYYINAINGNSVVLTRLRSHAEKEGATQEVLAFIDDLIIENNQCFKQAEIYSTIFSGLMDARGNLVNNNMNIHLKNLTIINVVFLPLNLIASIGGMSEYGMMTRGIDWRVSYLALSAAMLLVGWLTARVLRRMYSRPPARGSGMTLPRRRQTPNSKPTK